MFRELFKACTIDTPHRLRLTPRSNLSLRILNMSLDITVGAAEIFLELMKTHKGAYEPALPAEHSSSDAAIGSYIATNPTAKRKDSGRTVGIVMPESG